MKTVPSGMLEATPFSRNSTASGLRRVHHDTNHDVDVGGCRRRVRRASPSLSHEVLDGRRIGIAADDAEPGASKRHANSHRAARNVQQQRSSFTLNPR
jgi:hypothetical protein